MKHSPFASVESPELAVYRAEFPLAAASADKYEASLLEKFADPAALAQFTIGSIAVELGTEPQPLVAAAEDLGLLGRNDRNGALLAIDRGAEDTKYIFGQPAVLRLNRHRNMRITPLERFAQNSQVGVRIVKDIVKELDLRPIKLSQGQNARSWLNIDQIATIEAQMPAHKPPKGAISLRVLNDKLDRSPEYFRRLAEQLGFQATVYRDPEVGRSEQYFSPAQAKTLFEHMRMQRKGVRR